MTEKQTPDFRKRLFVIIFKVVLTIYLLILGVTLMLRIQDFPIKVHFPDSQFSQEFEKLKAPLIKEKRLFEKAIYVFSISEFIDKKNLRQYYHTHLSDLKPANEKDRLLIQYFQGTNNKSLAYMIEDAMEDSTISITEAHQIKQVWKKQYLAKRMENTSINELLFALTFFEDP